MKNILIKKIKNALKTENPLETINDIVSQYDEIERLIVWRDTVISTGRYYGSLVKEVDDINEKIKNSGYHQESVNEYFDRKIREYFESF